MADDMTKGEEDKLITRALMDESPNGGSTLAVLNSKSDQPKQGDCSVCPPPSTKNTNTTEPNGNGIGGKAKSCKGCLYYSSRLKDESRNPLCVGLTRSLPNVTEYIAGQSEVDAKALLEFRYACLGYSLYNDRKGQTSVGQGTQTELPFCVGLEVLVDRRVKSSEPVSASASHIRNKGDGNGLPQKGPPKPVYPTGDEFYSRFTRSASLVANGVAKNIRRVGNQIKQSLDDIMFRRPPK